MRNAFIHKTSYYLPQNRLSNEQLLELFPEASFERKLKELGIASRAIVSEGMTASDLAVHAAEKLFEEHQLDRQDIDFVLFCAQEFDYYTPTTACWIQHQLNLPERCGAMDFNLGCSGFVYGLSIAKGLIETGAATNVLLLTASTLTRKFHPKDKSSRAVFGDGAAATWISGREEDGGIGAFEFGTDGASFEKIIVKDGGGRNPLGPDSFVEETDDFGNVHSPGHFYMDGIGIFLFSNRRVPGLVETTLQKNGLQMADLDLVIFHQANGFLLETLRKKIGIPEDKFFVCMEETGNTVSSTVPIALREAIRRGKAKEGDTILLAAFGVGLSWGATVIRL